ncbi:isochorismatase family protein [Kineococcus sp. GCM10028916]|uniref:isochorismatase family protein n=1 Tax=Kineococcus sp. GCM10028916 TaxID=3273394 RepID=UPI00362C770C
MDIERRTPENTAVVLIDHVTGFANTFRSQTIPENVTGAVALAKTALGYGVPLVVSAGPEQDPRGPLYPQLTAVLGDHPVVHRAGSFGSFDAFDFPGFEEAVARTGRRHLAIAGLATEGCVLFTVLGALRRGYQVSLVVDATAGETPVIHDAAVSRMTSLGVTPTSWLSFATELQRDYDRVETVQTYFELLALSPVFGNNLSATLAAQAVGAAQAAAT